MPWPALVPQYGQKAAATLPVEGDQVLIPSAICLAMRSGMFESSLSLEMMYSLVKCPPQSNVMTNFHELIPLKAETVP